MKHIILSKIKKVYSTVKIKRWFLLSISIFIVFASVMLKTAYAYLVNVLPPVNQNIELVTFSPKELINDLHARLSYLAFRTNKVRFKVYKVKMRDNLWKVSKRNGYSVHTIIGCNPQLETYHIDVNQKLILPTHAGILHPIQSGDTFETIAERYEIKKEKLVEINKGRNDLIPGELVFIPNVKPDISLMNDKMRAKYELRSLFVSPLGGRLSSTYGKRRHPVTRKHSFHAGIDIAVRSGTWVGAAADGVVILAGSGIGHYGKAVYVRHKNGYVTHYGHLSKIYVKKGQKVKAHNLIAKSGSTGRSTGPHLHFTVKRNNKPIDPLKFLW